LAFDSPLKNNFSGQSRGMENNDRLRLNDPQRISSAVEGAEESLSRQQSTSYGSGDRSRQAPLIASRDSALGSSPQRGGRQQGYTYYQDESQFTTPAAIPANTMQFQSDYAHDPQRQQTFSQYNSNLMYNVPSQGPQSTNYDPSQGYQPRQSAAVEVLSNQFASVPQQYYPQSEPTSAAGGGVHLSQQQPSSQYTSLPFSQQNQPGRQPNLPQPYSTGMTLQQPSAPDQQMDFEGGDPPASHFDDAYTQYQTALRSTFRNTQDGRLVEAGESLATLTDWLLSNASELGRSQ
jgi:hypothetical protein